MQTKLGLLNILYNDVYIGEYKFKLQIAIDNRVGNQTQTQLFIVI